MNKTYNLLLASLLVAHVCAAQFSVTNLLTQSQVTPLGIDDKVPAFTWRMTAADDQYGVSQSAYQIIVKDSKGTVAWDTKKTMSSLSLNIPY